VRNLAHRFELPAFWSWWTGELARALPGASRTAVQRRRMRPILAFAPGAAVLWVPRVASGKLELVEQAQIPLGGDPAAAAQAGHAAIEGLARKHGPGDFLNQWAVATTQRLKGWGFNAAGQYSYQYVTKSSGLKERLPAEPSAPACL